MNEIMLECPFCEKRVIKYLYKPASDRVRRARGSSISKTMTFWTKEKYEILSKKCPNCGKTKKEIEKRLKEGKLIPHKELIRRIKEAGLPLKIK